MRLAPSVLIAGLLLAPHAYPAELDADEIIERAFAAVEANMEIARAYTFHSREEERMFNKNGEVKSTKSKTWDITLLEGSEYRRLIARDDQPLSAKEEAKEQRKLDKSIAKLQRETPKGRRKRLAKMEEERDKRRKFIAEVAKAFDFRVSGEEFLNGVDTYVIDATPRPGYKAPFRRAKILPKVRGRLWVAKEDFAWVKTDVETIEKISFGWFLFRLGKGARLEFQQQYINDEVWMMDRFEVSFQGRLGLLKGFNGAFTGTLTNFRKFSTESKVVAVGAVE